MEDARQQLAAELLGVGYEDLTPIQRSVIDLIATEAPTGLSPRLRVDERRPGEKVADAVAAFGGSWAFIGGFGAALALWMAWNFLSPRGLAFDPFPFIFLNLLLSTLAAVQAPIILMSQNRAAERDRQGAEHDYIVNLRAELEIMLLHDKLDRVRQDEIAQLLRQQRELVDALATPRSASPPK